MVRPSLHGVSSLRTERGDHPGWRSILSTSPACSSDTHHCRHQPAFGTVGAGRADPPRRIDAATTPTTETARAGTACGIGAIGAYAGKLRICDRRVWIEADLHARRSQP